MAKKRVDKEQVALKVVIDPIVVVVEPSDNQKELIERVQKAVIEEMTKKFPKSQYSYVEIGALTMEMAKPGLIVEEAGNPKNKGIVTGTNQKTINVTLTGGRNVQGSPSLFRVSNASFEEVASFYKQAQLNQTTPNGEPIQANSFDYYSEGDAGYLHNKGEVIPVVIGKGRGAKHKLFVINGGGTHYTLTEQQMKGMFTSTK